MPTSRLGSSGWGRPASASDRSVGPILAAHPQVRERPVSVFFLNSAMASPFQNSIMMASQKVRSPALWRVREMLNIPYVCLRFRDATMPCISNFLLSHLKRYDGLFSSPSIMMALVEQQRYRGRNHPFCLPTYSSYFPSFSSLASRNSVPLLDKPRLDAISTDSASG